MEIDRFDLDLDGVSFTSTGFLSQLGNLSDGDITSSPLFDLKLRDIGIRPSDIWEKNVKIKSLDLRGRADFDTRSLDLVSGKLSLFNAIFEFESFLKLDENNRLFDFDIPVSYTHLTLPTIYSV